MLTHGKQYADSFLKLSLAAFGFKLMEENKSSIEYFFLAGNAVIEGFCCFVGHAEVTQYFRLFFFLFTANLNILFPICQRSPCKTEVTWKTDAMRCLPVRPPGVTDIITVSSLLHVALE